MLRAVEIVAEAVGGQIRFMSSSCQFRVLGQLGRKEVACSYLAFRRVKHHNPTYL